MKDNFLLPWLLAMLAFVFTLFANRGLHRDLTQCRAQCSQAVGQLERSVGLSRECVATLQDAADLLQTAMRRPLVGARSDYVAQVGVR